MSDDIKVESKEVRVWLGVDDRQYGSEFDAMRSIVHAKLSKMFDGVGGYDSDSDGCADAVLDHREAVLRWLQLLDSAGKERAK